MPHSAESFHRGKPLVFINFGYRKSFGKRGEYQNFPSKFLSLTVPKVSVGGNPLRFHLFSGIEKVCVRGGGVSKVSVESYLSHSAEKFRWGESLMFHDFRVSKKFILQRVISRLSISC